MELNSDEYSQLLEDIQKRTFTANEDEIFKSIGEIISETEKDEE